MESTLAATWTGVKPVVLGADAARASGMPGASPVGLNVSTHSVRLWEWASVGVDCGMGECKGNAAEDCRSA